MPGRSSATRRRFLQGAGALAIGSLAGCIESRSPYAPPVVSNRPDAVYVPSHFEEMRPVGMKTDGPIAAALVFSYPHRFWLVSGAERTRVRIKPSDSIHLMVLLWDEPSRTVLAGTSPEVTVERDGTVVADRIFWPMLSQRMGFHYGDNLELGDDGTYRVSVSVPPTSAVPSDGFDGRLGEHRRFEFALDYSADELESLAINSVSDDRTGTEDALSPMEDGMAPLGTVAESLPGMALGTGVSDEMRVAASLDDQGSESVLSLTAATPYNGFALPMLGPVATVGGERIRLQETLDPDLGIHYRAAVPSGATEIKVEFPAPAQVARHEGYEMAFMRPSPLVFTR